MNHNVMLTETEWRRSAGPSVLDGPPELLECLPVATYACDAHGGLRWYNRHASELWGRAPDISRDSARFGGALRLRRLDGQPLRHELSPMARALRSGVSVHGERIVIERADGSHRICAVHIDPVRDRVGQVIGAIDCLHDVTELHRADEDHARRRRTLENELNHRVRNTLAAVQCLAAQILPRTGAPSAALDAFVGRLRALALTHDDLAASYWGGSDLAAIISSAFAPYGDEAAGRVFRSGEAVSLPPRAALTVAIVLHELASNASRHGALSQREGRIDLAWRVEGLNGARSLEIEWIESGGPTVELPRRPGFGTRLIERSLCGELGGTVRTAYDPSGFRCSMRLPLS